MTKVTKEEYNQIKHKLDLLSENYKEEIDEILKKANILSIIRGQINNCLELIARYEDEENLADAE